MLTVITGPPCAGKSTYARAHCRPDDIVIDFDDIAQALGSGVKHGHSRHLADVAAAAWAAAIREAVRQHQAGGRAWIVDSRPSAWRWGQYSQAGAVIVALTAEAAELHRRADDSRPPSWHQRIDQFLAVPPTIGSDPPPQPCTAW